MQIIDAAKAIGNSVDQAWFNEIRISVPESRLFEAQ
jgi:hypothetical protein